MKDTELDFWDGVIAGVSVTLVAMAIVIVTMNWMGWIGG